MSRLATACLALVGCYPGVDNGDCAIRCGDDGACPSNLSCVSSFCVDDGQICIDPALVLAYSFEQAEDRMVPDQSGNNNIAGIEGAPTLVSGVHGSAMEFDGDGDHLVTRHAPSLAVAPTGAFTVSFWIRIDPQQFLRDQIIVAKVVQNGQPVSPFYEFGIEFDMDDELLELYLGDDANRLLTAFEMTPQQGTFTHVAFTWDGVARGYLDGVEQSFEPDQSLQVTIPDRGQDLVIGAQTNANEFFSGALDDLRIYNRALSAAEIASDRDSAVTP